VKSSVSVLPPFERVHVEVSVVPTEIVHGNAVAELVVQAISVAVDDNVPDHEQLWPGESNVDVNEFPWMVIVDA
jgi:hypothetical protein